MNYNDRSSTIELEDGRPDLVKRSISKSRADNEIPAQENGFGDELSTEQIFASKQVPGWREQITFRGLFVSLIVSILLSVIVMKLSLTTGVIPSLNVSAGLLGFFFVKSWVKLLERSGLLKTPFTRQENTVIQTCVVASTGISFSGGFGSYLLGMSSRIYGEVGTTPGNNPSDTKDPQLGWIMGFLFVVSFLGLFAVVALRKIMIIDYKLTYPSGTATAVLINGFHTPQGSIVARKQVAYLGKYFVFSFLFGFFQWFYTGGDNCGFANFPTLGMKARDNKFYFDFSMTYIGAGMICPHLVNISLVVGAIASYGIMWPLIKNRKGDWYDSGLKPNSMSGIQGYKVFISIALILGDGLYNFVKITYITLSTIYRETKKKNRAVTDLNEQHPDEIPYDEQRRNEVFLKDNIPLWMAACGYVVLAAISIGVIPHMFPAVKWYYVLMAYIVAPVLGFCNAYGCGLTDWSLATSYGKLALFIFGAWAGKDHGGVMAALSTCGVMMSIVATASDLTQDFKTGYLTLSSPRAMFLAQVIGTAMGCIIAPSIFILFNKAFDLGNQQGDYPSPNALVFRNMAILAVEGFSALPKHCLTLCYGFFAFAIVVNLIRDKVPKRISQRIPIPMAMAIPFFLGGYFTIDMFVGTIIVFIWQRRNRTSADLYVPAVASGLLCGDGIWSLPSSILALAKVKAPICMKFLPRSVNVKVDGYLGYN